MTNRHTRADAVLAGLIFAASVAYLAALPRNLNPADESVHLYEAKRILDGEVLYRDVFNFITPGWFYLMAALFHVFGVSMATARIAMAVMHGLTATLSYLTCRRLGVRRGLSWLPALAYLVIAQSAWPITSQHWVTALLTAALLYVCAGRRRERAAWALWPGIILGLLIGVQQQRGLFVGVGLFAWLIGDAVLRLWFRAREPSESLAKEMIALAAGALLSLLPLLAPSIIGAGIDRAWYALVTFPVFNYRATTHSPWGAVNIMTAWQASFTVPIVLKYMPIILLVSVPRLFFLCIHRRDHARASVLLLLILFCCVSMLSVVYFPDFVHLAFIAPVFFVTAAEGLEWAVQRIPAPARFVRLAGALAGIAILALGGYRLADNLVRLRRAFPLSHVTGFGRVDFANEEEVRLYENVNALLDGAPSRALYVYPVLSDLYLTARADNPTPYGFFSALGYNTPAQVQEVLDILATRPPAYVVVFAAFLTSDDPIIHYITREYEPVATTGLAGRAIFRRKGEPVTASVPQP